MINSVNNGSNLRNWRNPLPLKTRDVSSNDRLKTFYSMGGGGYDESIHNIGNPITSYGIILFTRSANNEIKFLLCQRKDTIQYTHFIRGNMKDFDDTRFELMTEREHYQLLYINYRSQVNDLVYNRRIREDLYKNEKLYTALYPQICEKLGKCRKTPGWEFTKGRKNDSENDISAALREFEEETGCTLNGINLTSLKPIREIYRGTDGMLYSTIFFICESETEFPIKYYTENNRSIISSEVGCMMWTSIKGAKKLVQETHQHRCDIIDHVVDCATNRYHHIPLPKPRRPKKKIMRRKYSRNQTSIHRSYGIDNICLNVDGVSIDVHKTVNEISSK